MSGFSTGDGYERFMELVGRHVPRPPAYVDLLGARPLYVEPGQMRFEFNATEQFLNPAGVVQGGFITAMLDETMGPAALAALGPGHMVPTLELKVSFLRPVRPGRLVADARVVHRGRSVVFLESSLRDEDGTLLATATATARIVEFGAWAMTTAAVHARVTGEPLSLERLAQGVARPAAGAVVTFQGTTRDVERLEYDAYAEMAEERIAAIVAAAVDRHGLAAAAAEHRIGNVPLGESSVIVAASAAHRERGVRGRARDHRPHQG